MKKLLLIAASLLAVIIVHAQTCTLTGTTLDWPSNNNPPCLEGGNAIGKTTLVIPAGLTVNFDNNDTWTGTTLVVNGTLNINGPGSVVINSSIEVNNGGYVYVPAKLNLGTDADCGYTLIIRTGGELKTSASASDQLNICGQPIIKGGGGGCNPNYPAGEPPYCDTGGFTGPTAVDDDGYNGSLPIQLTYFTVGAADEAVTLKWATSMEESFSHFIIQRSSDGKVFEDIGQEEGQGFNIYDIESKYFFVDEAPLLGANYYRLKAVDLDNSYEFSEVRLVRINGAKRLAVYPNPSDGESISFRVNFNAQESDRIYLVDQLGVEVFSALATAAENTIRFRSPLGPGVYMLRYVSRDFEQVTRVVITR